MIVMSGSLMKMIAMSGGQISNENLKGVTSPEKSSTVLEAWGFGYNDSRGQRI